MVNPGKALTGKSVFDENDKLRDSPETKTGPKTAQPKLWTVPAFTDRKFDFRTIRVDEKIIKALAGQQGFIVKVVSKFYDLLFIIGLSNLTPVILHCNIFRF